MNNQKAYAHMYFDRKQLLRFLLRGHLDVRITVDYKKQTLSWEWSERDDRIKELTKENE